MMNYLIGDSWLWSTAWFPPIVILLSIWTLFWKGLGLWHSARRSQPWWFVILLLVNMLGILEIIYIFAIAKIKPEDLFSKKA